MLRSKSESTPKAETIHLRSEDPGVHSPGEREEAAGRNKARGQVALAVCLRDRDDEIGLAIEPTVQGMRSNGQNNVAGSDERARYREKPVGNRCQPVFFSAVNMDEVESWEQEAEGGKIPQVGHGGESRNHLERDEAVHPEGSKRRRDLRDTGTAGQRHFLALALQLLNDPSRPVGVGAPPPTAHQVKRFEGPVTHREGSGRRPPS
jgi:hypothetical protein